MRRWAWRQSWRDLLFSHWPRSADRIVYRWDRSGARFSGWYEPASEVYTSAPGSLEHWLSEAS